MMDNLLPSIPHLEYRRHRDTTNPLHIIGFLTQWKIYLDNLPSSKDGGQFKGRKLDTAVFEKVRSWCLGPLL
jgi:Complex1_LYR-like